MEETPPLETGAPPPTPAAEPPAEATAEGAGEAAETPQAPPAPDPELEEAVAVVEALLYASGKPASLDRLAEAAELPPERVEAAVTELERRCNVDGRGIRLERVAGGVRVVSRPEFDYPVRRLLGLDGKTKLSMAALETLSIIAYRQPVTAPEVAELRGVSSASSIRTLLDRKLITTAGRKEVVGTPFLYKTTKEFLVHFGLSNLSELPKPEELEALYGIEAPAPPDPAQAELFPSDEPGEPGADEGAERRAGEAAEAPAAEVPLVEASGSTAEPEAADAAGAAPPDGKRED